MHDGVLLVVRIRFGEIESKVNATRLLAMDGTVDNQRGDTYKVAEFKDVGIDAVSPVELTDFPVKVAQAATRP